MDEIKLEFLDYNGGDIEGRYPVLKDFKGGIISECTDYCNHVPMYSYRSYRVSGNKGVYYNGNIKSIDNTTFYGLRPIIKLPDDLYDELMFDSYDEDGVKKVKFGRFPQSYCDDDKSKKLNEMMLDKKSSLTLEKIYDGIGLEYSSNLSQRNVIYTKNQSTLDSEWFEIEDVVWLVDIITKTLICEKVIAFNDYIKEQIAIRPVLDIEVNTIQLMNDFMKPFLLKDAKSLFVTGTHDNKSDSVKKEESLKSANPYGLVFDGVSEEDIIKGMVDSNVSVFLHGRSSEGKSARVKQIDPDCEIIYLRNASPDSLNGKSVFNSNTNEMLDIKPTWLINVEEKCAKEPDKLHIIFFDEITNALPSIQGIAFNIILDKEVNGKWKLPDNARIVAAGNEVDDSLSANRLAEPLFNRFAHVYIKTKTKDWLIWAKENNIHPAIIAFIAESNGVYLRQNYNGETPNADPRKWEMASNLLYSCNNPYALRSLIGEDLTNKFLEFCSKYTGQEIAKYNSPEPEALENVPEQDINQNNSSNNLPKDPSLLYSLSFIDTTFHSMSIYKAGIKKLYNNIMKDIEEHITRLVPSGFEIIFDNIYDCILAPDSLEFQWARRDFETYLNQISNQGVDPDIIIYCLSIVDMFNKYYPPSRKDNMIKKLTRSREI